MVYNDVTIVQNVAATLSCFSSLAVVLTLVFFSTLRAKQYIRWVFYIAINDLCATLALAIGRSSNSVACWFQGIFSNYNSLASICWITFISYKVYRILLKSQKQLDLGEDKTVAQIEIYDNDTNAVLDNNRVVHVICWGLPFIVTVIPMMAGYKYENSSDDDVTSYGNWCVLVSNGDHSPTYELLLFKIASFYLWVWIAIIINGVYVYQTKRLFRHSFVRASEEIRAMMKDTLHRLEYYPYILIFCWIPSTIIEVFSLDQNVVGYGVATFLTLLQGLLCSLVFFTVNPDVRLRWYHLLCCRPVEEAGEGDEDLLRDLIRKNSADEYVTGSFSEWTASPDKYTQDFSHGLSSGYSSLNNSYNLTNSFNVGTTGVHGMRNNNHIIYSALTNPPIAPIHSSSAAPAAPQPSHSAASSSVDHPPSQRPSMEPNRASSMYADSAFAGLDDEDDDNGRR